MSATVLQFSKPASPRHWRKHDPSGEFAAAIGEPPWRVWERIDELTATEYKPRADAILRAFSERAERVLASPEAWDADRVKWAREFRAAINQLYREAFPCR